MEEKHMEHISGGVCAAKGFQAGGIHCGIRKNRGKRDISMIVSEVPASAAAVYTSNLVKGAPIYVTQRNLAGGIAQLAVCNSGNANTCNADGEEVAWQMCELAGKAAGIDPHHVIVASTGVIGQPLSIEPIAQHMGALYAAVKDNGSQEAAEGIMTTDTGRKARREVRHLLQPAEGRHFRRGCELGARAVRAGLLRRGNRREEGGCRLPQRRRLD